MKRNSDRGGGEMEDEEIVPRLLAAGILLLLVALPWFHPDLGTHTVGSMQDGTSLNDPPAVVDSVTDPMTVRALKIERD